MFINSGLVVPLGGQLIRYSEQAQRYVNTEIFYKLYVVSVILNCHTDIIHVLLAVDVKQAMIFVVICHTVVILCDGFTG